MEMFNAAVEVDKRDAFEIATVMSRLEGFHAAIGTSPRGYAGATISLPGEQLAQAAAAAIAVVAAAFDAPAITVEVMTEKEFAARQGFVPVPDLVSVSEAAELLGVSRQAVLQRIQTKSLPATRVGRDYVVPRSAVVVGSSTTEE